MDSDSGGDRLDFYRQGFVFSTSEAAWKGLKDEFEQWRSQDELSQSYDVACFAATGLAIRKLTFGGVVRANRENSLNIKYCEGQVKEFRGWEFKFPSLPDAEVAVAEDFRSAIASFGDSDLPSAEALIDPPYFAPKSAGRTCTAAYIGHEPHSSATMDLCLEAFDLCLADERIRLINVTNYFSEVLDLGLRAIAFKHGQEISIKKTGELKSMNKSGEERAGEAEAIWTVKRKI